MLRCCLALLVALAVAAAPAHALPGDPGFEPLSPADGAALTVDPDGIPVAFTCPVYRISDPGFPVFGGARDYGVSFATSPALGSDGRLADAVALGTGSQDGPDRCVSALGAGGSPPRPQETPGTYYWQVWRLCTGCTGSYETGPVRRLVLRAAAALTARPPRRVYAGHPFILSVRLAGVPDFTPFRVERAIGGGWKEAGAGTATGEQGEPTVLLPAGATRVRAAVQLGAELVTSPEVAVRVRRARGWSTKARDDGRYTGRRGGERSVRLRVAKRGREVRGFTSHVTMLCPTPGMLGQFTTQIGTAALKRVRIAPDGSFVGAATPEAATSIRVRGRLHDRRISGGRVELSVDTCSGSAKFSAARTG